MELAPGMIPSLQKGYEDLATWREEVSAARKHCEQSVSVLAQVESVLRDRMNTYRTWVRAHCTDEQMAAILTVPF